MLTHDFSNVATLGHRLSASVTFDGVTELGRAVATVGSGDAELRFVAGRLGSVLNGTVVTVAAADASPIVQLDPAPAGGTRRVRFVPETTDSAADAAERFPTLLRNASASREVAAFAEISRIAVDAGGSGADPVAAGSATFAGGAEPSLFGGMSLFESATVNGGLFIFDADEALLLRQFAFDLSASVAWTLTMRLLTPARGDMGHYVPVANATSQRGIVTTPVIIPPGWGLCFAAAAQGLAAASVSLVRR